MILCAWEKVSLHIFMLAYEQFLQWTLKCPVLLPKSITLSNTIQLPVKPGKVIKSLAVYTNRFSIYFAKIRSAL